MNTTNQIKNEGKKFNLFTKEDLPKILFENQHIEYSDFRYNYSDKINSMQASIPDNLLNKYDPTLMIEVREQKRGDKIELVYIEHGYTCYLTPKGNIAILNYNSKNKKYFFMPYYGYYREVQDISYYIREKAKKELNLIEPNYIGKFTDKKISEWLEYCDKEIELNNQLVNTSNSKNNDIKEKIQNFIDKSNGRVSKYGEKTEVHLPNFKITFTHNIESQYLDTQITFCGDINDVLNIINK